MTESHGQSLTPNSEAEVVDGVERALREGSGLRIEGAGLGPGLHDPAHTLSTLGLTGVRHFDPADLTVTVAAGTRLSELQAILHEERQWLPMDPPRGDGVTIGGMVASGTPGPLATGFGRPRDHLLGLTLVDGRARVLRLGGRVVKNVAGFDLVRLAAGSRGSLGVITELTLRVFPIPPAERSLVWSFDSVETGWRRAWAAASLPFPFSAAELASAEEDGVEGDGAQALFRLTGSAGEVRTGERMLRSALGEPSRALDGEESREFWDRRSGSEGGGIPTLRAAGLPSQGRRLVEGLKALEDALGQPRWGLHLVKGIMRADWNGSGGAQPDGTGPALSHFLEEVRRSGGSAQVAGKGYPLEVASNRLEAGIREVFDPHGIFRGSRSRKWS